MPIVIIESTALYCVSPSWLAWPLGGMYCSMSSLRKPNPWLTRGLRSGFNSGGRATNDVPITPVERETHV